MLPVTTAEAAKAMGAVVIPESDGILDRPFPAVSIDTRTLREGQCYFAIRGHRFDGHQFIPRAVAGGARAVVAAQEPSFAPSDRCLWLRVADTTRALQDLGRRVRAEWEHPLIAVTGSMGKTTTRRFVSHVLAQRFQVMETPGNFNNHLGVPLSLMALETNHEMAVLELGMNHPGEIAELAQLCSPTAGLITNIAPVHTEFFASLDAVAEAKAELIEHLPREGWLFYNGDDKRVARIASRFTGQTISFGYSQGVDFRVVEAKFQGTLRTALTVESGDLRLEADLPLVGRPFVYGAAAAVAVAHRFGVEAALIRQALESTAAVRRRGQVLRVGELTIYDDSYNSSPKAVEALIDTLSELTERRRCVLVLGDMLELGDSSATFHEEIGRRVAQLDPASLVTVGEESRHISEAAAAAGYPRANQRHFSDSSSAAEYLAEAVQPGDFVAIKGSRGVRMEKIVERLKEERA